MTGVKSGWNYAATPPYASMACREALLFRHLFLKREEGGGGVRGSKVRAEVCNCCHFDVLPLCIVARGRLPATSLNCSIFRNSFTSDILSAEGDVNAINLTE